MRAADLARSSTASERGSGVFSTSSALLVFLMLILGAVHVTAGLYARSMATNAAHDAARRVAGYASVAGRAEARAIEGERFASRFGANTDAQLVWSPDDREVVTVRVIVESPSLLPAGLHDLFGIGHTDREIRVRVERER